MFFFCFRFKGLVGKNRLRGFELYLNNRKNIFKGFFSRNFNGLVFS